MPDIGDQPVGDVDGGTGRNKPAQVEPRLRHPVTDGKRLPVNLRQSKILTP